MTDADGQGIHWALGRGGVVQLRRDWLVQVRAFKHGNAKTHRLQRGRISSGAWLVGSKGPRAHSCVCTCQQRARCGGCLGRGHGICLCTVVHVLLVDVVVVVVHFMLAYAGNMPPSEYRGSNFIECCRRVRVVGCII